MMVNRRHFKETLTVSCLKICNLDHNRKHFHYINQPYDQKEKRHLHHIGCACHKSSKSKRTCVTHKYLCRIYVKQEKSHKSSYYCAGDRLDPGFQPERYDCKKYSYDQSNAGRKTIKTVCKVHAVYCSDHSKKQDRHCKPACIQVMSAPERNPHSKGNICIIYNIKCKDSRYYYLEEKFLPGKKTV